MLNKQFKLALLLFITIAFLVSYVQAQTVKEPTDTPAEWSKPYAPFRIAGNLYYVGTQDLACYLITSKQGHILINTGLANSERIITDNIQKLGFKLADIKILLTTQAHYDHMAAMAALKKQTGAKLYADKADAQVMRDGGASDYALGNGTATYTPVHPDKLLNNGSVINLGPNKITLLHHPGHTKGSCSYLLTTSDSSRTYRVLIANLPTIVTEKDFDEVTAYPSIQQDYASTLRSMKTLKFDIWVASHASQFNLEKKHQPGSSYNPAAFMDQQGYNKALANLQSAFDKKVKSTKIR